jgi:HEAT repeat protein
MAGPKPPDKPPEDRSEADLPAAAEQPQFLTSPPISPQGQPRHVDASPVIVQPSAGTRVVDPEVEELISRFRTASSEPDDEHRGRTKCNLVDLLREAASRTDSAIEALVDLLDDPDGYEAGNGFDPWYESVTSRVQTRLSELGERAVPYLVARLDEPGPGGFAAMVLWRLGPLARCAMDELERRVAVSGYASMAGGILLQIRRDEDATVGIIAALLADPVTRNSGLNASSSLTVERLEKLLAPLTNLLADSDADIRRIAANRIGLIGAAAASVCESFLPLLDDPFEDVAREALHALELIGGTSERMARRLLAQVVDTRAPLRGDTIRALAHQSPETLAPLAPTLIERLRDRDDPQRYEVARIFEAIGPLTPADAVQAIVRCFEVATPSDERGLFFLMRALAAIGPSAQSALPVLKAHRRRHESKYIRDAAAEAISAIAEPSRGGPPSNGPFRS